MEGDGETMYAYYCLHRFHWRPRMFESMPAREKALVIAMIDERIKQEKLEADRIRRKRR